MLFKKLIARDVPMCFVRLLQFWYSHQSMQVRWGGSLSRSFKVTNGVRQGGVLSPYLFAIYMDDLSQKLNKLRVGCMINDSCLNHILFADDLCCFSPSLTGLQNLVDECNAYASSHDIVFNYRKSAGVLFSPKNFKLSKPPFLLLGLDKIEFVDRVKYLGIIMDSSSNENCDISRQTRALYCIGNKLRSKFSLCSTYVKNILFKSYCMSLYGSSLWHNYNSYAIRRLRVAYNDAFRMIHGLPRHTSASVQQILFNVYTFDALIRKSLFSFVKRCCASPNLWINALMNSDVFYESKYFHMYCNTVYEGGTSYDLVKNHLLSNVV